MYLSSMETYCLISMFLPPPRFGIDPPIFKVCFGVFFSPSKRIPGLLLCSVHVLFAQSPNAMIRDDETNWLRCDNQWWVGPIPRYPTWAGVVHLQSCSFRLVPSGKGGKGLGHLPSPTQKLRILGQSIKDGMGDVIKKNMQYYKMRAIWSTSSFHDALQHASNTIKFYGRPSLKHFPMARILELLEVSCVVRRSLILAHHRHNCKNMRDNIL